MLVENYQINFQFMKKYIILSLLFIITSCYLFAQPSKQVNSDSVNMQKYNKIFERVVQQKAINFPLRNLFPKQKDFINLMMLFSSDGYFGYSKSQFLTLSNIWNDILELEDLDGYQADLEMVNNGFLRFRNGDGFSLSSFQKNKDQFVVRDEDNEVFTLKLDWLLNLQEVQSESGYHLKIEKIKSGHKISDNMGNYAEVTKVKSNIFKITDNNGNEQLANRGTWGAKSTITQGNTTIFSINYDLHADTYEIKDNQGTSLVVKNLYKYDHSQPNGNVGVSIN